MFIIDFVPIKPEQVQRIVLFVHSAPFDDTDNIYRDERPWQRREIPIQFTQKLPGGNVVHLRCDKRISLTHIGDT